MFSVGDKVVYKTNAVCIVEEIETPAFAKGNGNKYYKLRYLFSKGNEVVYVPVDSEVNIRKVMSNSDAERCLALLKEIEAADFQAKQPALITAHFHEILSDGSAEGSLAALKELLLKEKKSTEQGKKLKQVEEHFLGIVEKAVSEEFSIALGKEIDHVRMMIRNAACGE